MNLALVYLLLLKATLSAFSGLAALPVLREEFVVRHHLLTDRQLNTALVVGRTTPGPKGLYIVSVGYYAACAVGRVDPAEGIQPLYGYLVALVLGVIVIAAVPWFSIGFL